ncbi:MAG: TerB family tellurite resistance protein [Gemmatimonadetes bacterium]|nr:TerB family tellurite resistance protein [Gemmatimonadota bacterium]NIQ58376.1 TerB family tellurite resistance protein [Gemmatimonadota bacterium]NIU78592.1 TerB family tellurite resistance protein [Gammaproteobacteria bacterium]NIX47432.1 TerB family tellurite resistance protein [Gemmatimonadota bacterium]NIY11815.1 TerB family tellurite resistance protein [Gemmatimonadota bacterium]
MENRIRSYFERNMELPGDRGEEDPGVAARRRLHIAACALMLELAHADDEFSAEERLHIEVVLRRHFALDEAEALELMELAESERESANDVYRFADLIRSSYDMGQKTLLAEVMWGVISADGRIARHEAYLLRKIANLLDLEPGYLSEARDGRDLE